MAGGGISRPGSDKMLSVLSSALMQCSVHAEAYGACAQKMLPEVQRGACAKELSSLKECFLRVVKSGKLKR